MTAPRQVVPGRTYLVSRRCTQRQFLLRPDPEVERIYLYCLGEAAQRYDVTLHAWMAMSNHQHLLVRDNHGNLPDFLAHLNKMIAKALNAKWKRWENLWATEQPNAVYVVEAADRFAKLIYLLANPVADHLVEHVVDWPGANSLRFHLTGAEKTVARPLGYFRKEGPMPEFVTLRAERLEGFEHLTHEEWVDMIRSAIESAERQAREARAEKQQRVLGRKSVLRAQHTDSPDTIEPRRGLRPQVACRDERRRAHELAMLKGFRSAHRAALRQWLEGDRQTVFPTGTYRMRRLGARCELSQGALAPTPLPLY